MKKIITLKETLSESGIAKIEELLLESRADFVIDQERNCLILKNANADVVRAVMTKLNGIGITFL